MRYSGRVSISTVGRVARTSAGFCAVQRLIAGGKRSDAIVAGFFAGFVGAAVAQRKLHAVLYRMSAATIASDASVMRGSSPRSGAPGWRSSGGVTSARKIRFQRPGDTGGDIGHVKNGVGKLLFEHARLNVGGQPLADQNDFPRDSVRESPRESATAKTPRRSTAPKCRTTRIGGATRCPGTPAARMAVISPSVDMRLSVINVPRPAHPWES